MASSRPVIAGQAATQSALGERAPRGGNRLRLFLRELVRTRLVPTGLVTLAIVLFCALFAGIIAPYSPNEQDYTALTEAPSVRHFLGTDEIGRDVLSRIIYGSRVSLEVGIIAVGIALAFGVTFGVIAG